MSNFYSNHYLSVPIYKHEDKTVKNQYYANRE